MQTMGPLFQIQSQTIQLPNKQGWNTEYNEKKVDIKTYDPNDFSSMVYTIMIQRIPVLKTKEINAKAVLEGLTSQRNTETCFLA